MQLFETGIVDQLKGFGRIGFSEWRQNVGHHLAGQLLLVFGEVGDRNAGQFRGVALESDRLAGLLGAWIGAESDFALFAALAA